LDRLLAVGELLAVHAEAAGLDRELEARRRGFPPLGPAVRLEAGIVGPVDLDRGEVARGVLELTLLGELLGIEDAAPGLEGPAADAATDPAGVRHGRPS